MQVGGVMEAYLKKFRRKYVGCYCVTGMDLWREYNIPI